MRKLNIVLFFLLFVFNLILFGVFIAAQVRPVMYYEYLFLPFIFSFLKSSFKKWIILLLLIFLDLLLSLSHFYYVNAFDFLKKFPSLFDSAFTLKFWASTGLLLFILLGYCFLLINLLPKYLNKNKSSNLLYTGVTSLTLFIIICSASHLITYKRQIFIGGSVANKLYKDLSISLKSYKKLADIDNFSYLKQDSSVAYKYLYHSTAKKELLVVLESWGMLKNKTLLQYQINSFLETDSAAYSIKLDSSCFKGPTYHGEARELLNKEGEGYYSVLYNDPVNVQSIVGKKKKDGFYAISAQPFSASFSSGFTFRKILGFQDIKDYRYFHDTVKNADMVNNHYAAVADEIAFDYLVKQMQLKDKVFAYCLTINTHLPFGLDQPQMQSVFYKEVDKKYAKSFPTAESFQQYFRFILEFKHIAQLIKQYPVDKIVLVGDHGPPFLKTDEREFFSDRYIPALIIERKK